MLRGNLLFGLPAMTFAFFFAGAEVLPDSDGAGQSPASLASSSLASSMIARARVVRFLDERRTPSAGEPDPDASGSWSAASMVALTARIDSENARSVDTSCIGFRNEREMKD